MRGHGQGAHGPEADKAAFDGTAYWARAGLADTLRPAELTDPLGARPAIGDVMGGLAIAGGIAAALFERERTGVARVVDISLLNTGMWQLQGDIAMTGALGLDDVLRFGGGRGGNPLVGNYPTEDGRFVFLNMMQADRFWPDLCTHLGRPDLIDDPRFADAAVRAEHGEECVEVLSDVFRTRTLDEWRDAFTHARGGVGAGAAGARAQARRPGRRQRLPPGGAPTPRVARTTWWARRRSSTGRPTSSGRRPSTASTPTRCCSTSATRGTSSSSSRSPATSPERCLDVRDGRPVGDPHVRWSVDGGEAPATIDRPSGATR